MNTIMAATADSSPRKVRDRVTWRDLAWVTWRQHRLMLVGTGSIVAIGAVLMGLVALAAGTRGSLAISVLMFDDLGAPADLLATCILGFGAVVAVFWGGPLLSKEYEQRTHLFAWSQDVSALRMLVGKTLLLAAAAVSFAVLLGSVGTMMLRQIDTADTELGYARFSAFRMPFFEAAPLVQVGYTLFGLALGLAVSALSRRTVLSMGLTLVIFTVVRAVVGGLLRPYYQTPVREVYALDWRGGWDMPDKALYVDSGYLNTVGEPVDFPAACTGNMSSAADHQACMRENGIASNYRAYQPIERVDEFRLIEFGIFAGLAILLFLLTWRLMRRVTRL